MTHILAIDVGGTHVKVLVSGKRKARKLASGRSMTPKRLIKDVKRLTADWSYDRVSLGYPGLVVHGRIAADPRNLGPGWVGFDFGEAFGLPVRLVNDAAMQALGDYRGGRMLFLGLGTGLGSTMIVDGQMQPMELAHLPYKDGRTYEDFVGLRALEKVGKRRWRKRVWTVVDLLRHALEPDTIVIGGGNARLLRRRPRDVRIGKNATAFTGGFRLWQESTGISKPRTRKEGFNK